MYFGQTKQQTSTVDNDNTNFSEIGVICCYFISLVKVDREYNNINKASEPRVFWMEFHLVYNFLQRIHKEFHYQHTPQKYIISFTGMFSFSLESEIF